jgi:8-oxo-dGTP diphosphatase
MFDQLDGLNGSEEVWAMSIRNAIKALVVHHDRILLVRCVDNDGGEYYTLPGGGQAQYETMEETLVRECLEEMGYHVVPLKYVALYEEIIEDSDLRSLYPDYTHLVYHVFLCRLQNEGAGEVARRDKDQVGVEWTDIEDPRLANLRPTAIRDVLAGLIEGSKPVFLGSRRLHAGSPQP